MSQIRDYAASGVHAAPGRGGGWSVRDKGGYALTALAAALAEQVDAVCGAAERLFAASTHFDPSTSDREFIL
jgi:hypothetical protein